MNKEKKTYAEKKYSIQYAPTQGHTDKLKQHSENITINKMLPELCLVSHTSYNQPQLSQLCFDGFTL